MTNYTENHQPDSELTLRDRTNPPLTVRATNLSLTKQEDQLIECRLTFSVNPELYQRIDTQSLFNLKPELRGAFPSEFLPSPDIKIEISLKPDLLPHLVEHAANPNEAANYLLNISGEKPDDPLLSTENWLGLSVKQQQESGEIGYTTFWNYINPSAVASGGINNEEVGNAIANFFKEWTEANLSAITQKGTSEILDGIVNFLKRWLMLLWMRSLNPPLPADKSLRKWSISSNKTHGLFTKLKENQIYKWLSKVKMANGLAELKLESNKNNSYFTLFVRSTHQIPSEWQ
jgi:hypothetical protein